MVASNYACSLVLYTSFLGFLTPAVPPPRTQDLYLVRFQHQIHVTVSIA